jgi:coenzyme PQQ precursor peptide PqqA
MGARCAVLRPEGASHPTVRRGNYIRDRTFPTRELPGTLVFTIIVMLALSCITRTGRMIMAWTTPTLVEICIGLEINGYLPAEF